MRDSERENLEAHVDMCGSRYGEIYRRLARIEYWLYGIVALLLIGEGTIGDLVKRLFSAGG